jgi:MFS family permease
LKQDGQFLWNKPTQGIILSAYFYGYVTTQVNLLLHKVENYNNNTLSYHQKLNKKVLGGFLSIKLGAKVVLGAAIFVGSILTVIIPFAAQTSYVALVACRFLTGVAHGSFWPACATLWVQKNAKNTNPTLA